MTKLTFTNTMTHDEWRPWKVEFTLLTYRDDDGDRIVEHNGFDNIDKQTVEDFKAIVAMMEVQLAVNESKNRGEVK